MPSFRLLPQHPLLVVAGDERLADWLRCEGFDVRFTRPRGALPWLSFCASLLFNSKKYHWIVQSPLSANLEKALFVPLRAFPFLIASWTRVDDENLLFFETRLLNLAERDYNQIEQQGPLHDRMDHPGTRRSSDSEFDQLLKTSHP
jgi:hypothetical protein